jgi:hypothetical protein
LGTTRVSGWMQLARAFDVLDDMMAAGCTPNVVTYSSLIAACANRGQCFRAEKVCVCALGRAPSTMRGGLAVLCTRPCIVPQAIHRSSDPPCA